MSQAMRLGLRAALLLLPVLAVLAVLGLAVHAAWRGWTALGETAMSGHGIAALLLGGFFTLLLTGVLVGLLLYSRRNGYDQ